MHTIRKSLLLCLVLAATAVTTRAATLNVPGQYLTIQAAISAAADGDTVQVAAGTYVENITWNNRALILEGAGEGQSIIDGGSANSCLHLLNVPSTARIVGFTIQNGNAPNYGGGMHNESSSPTVTHCTFRNNYSSIGGGMMNSHSSPAVINCTFTGNSAINFGGGMDNHENSNPTVVNCIFTGNSTPFLAGGMDNVDSSPAVTNCTFTRNSSSFGGAMVFYYGSPSVINCTFTGNTVAAYGTVYSFDSHILVINCILWGDTGGEMSPDPSSTILPIVTYSDVQGGYAGTGNIDADPLFVNAVGGDMRLQAGSPCINAGNNAAVIVTTDLDGNARIVNGMVDIGALEVQVGCDQPVVATITGPASGSVYAVGTPVTFTGTFTDANGPHTAQWTIGGNVVPGVVDENAQTVTATVTFASDGVYPVELTVANACGNSTTRSVVGWLSALVVIYDPSAGFVTGGGWINSPAGAYVADPTLTGEASFGFVSKYQKGATVPTGDTEFQFNTGNLDFKSTSYQWLVVSGARAQYKGAGNINGAPGYGFLLTAIDGQIDGGGGTDKFRIKIWNAAGIVYDNQMGADDSGTPTTTLGGGSIVIHK